MGYITQNSNSPSKLVMVGRKISQYAHGRMFDFFQIIRIHNKNQSRPEPFRVNAAEALSKWYKSFPGKFPNTIKGLSKIKLFFISLEMSFNGWRAMGRIIRSFPEDFLCRKHMHEGSQYQFTKCNGEKNRLQQRKQIPPMKPASKWKDRRGFN